MDTALIYELIGYVASALVAISLMMTSILRLRILNLIGAAAFTVYGLLIVAYPVAVVNAIIVGINVYHLWRMRAEEEYFKLLEVRPESDYLGYFLRFYRDEIRRFFPAFEPDVREGEMSLFVLRNMVPAGLLLGRPRGDGTLDVRLDFVIPGYRDLEVGDFLFDRQSGYFRGKGIRRIEAEAGTKEHAAYLRKMGFRAAEGDGVMERRIGEG